MPVCAACGRYWSPRSARGGACGACGGAVTGVPVAVETPPGAAPAAMDEGAAVEERLPWHLKLLAVSFCLYMAWRLWELVEWLMDRL